MEDITKLIASDKDGMTTYEYIANHVDSSLNQMSELIDNLKRVDTTGQFLCSTARFLAAIDSERFNLSISRLISAAIEKDREKRYIGSLLCAIWGNDYNDHVDELKQKDDNFRRVYKRVYDNNLI